MILLSFVYIYIKYHEQKSFFYIKDEDGKYNLVNLIFIYLNLEDYIEQTNLILLKEDAIDLKDILEDCYINNIKLDIKKEIR